jgi:hypothetical protein
MNINNRSTLAFAVALLLGAGTASAAGTLDLTIQVLDLSSMEPVNQLDIPDDVSTDQVSVEDADSNDDHGKAVSQVAKGLKSTHENDKLVNLASNKKVAADAAEAAEDHATDAAEVAADVAKENAAEAAEVLKDSVNDTTTDMTTTTDMVMLQVTL